MQPSKLYVNILHLCYGWVNRHLRLWKKKLLQASNAKWMIQKDGNRFLWSIYQRLYCHCVVLRIISLLLRKGLASSHFDPDSSPMLWNERWCDCIAVRRVCSLSLSFKEVFQLIATCPVHFLLKTNLPTLPLMSMPLQHHGKGTVDFHTGRKVCICTHQWVCIFVRVCVWVSVCELEREREMARGRLKSERKHSPALSSH